MVNTKSLINTSEIFDKQRKIKDGKNFSSRKFCLETLSQASNNTHISPTKDPKKALSKHLKSPDSCQVIFDPKLQKHHGKHFDSESELKSQGSGHSKNPSFTSS